MVLNNGWLSETLHRGKTCCRDLRTTASVQLCSFHTLCLIMAYLPGISDCWSRISGQVALTVMFSVSYEVKLILAQHSDNRWTLADVCGYWCKSDVDVTELCLSKPKIAFNQREQNEDPNNQNILTGTLKWKHLKGELDQNRCFGNALTFHKWIKCGFSPL